LGWQPGACRFKTFDNGEISAKVEQSVANHDVYVICARNDHDVEMNFNIMQLLLFVA
jgi:phosphoribosylpyrophosphate synthetase